MADYSLDTGLSGDGLSGDGLSGDGLSGYDMFGDVMSGDAGEHLAVAAGGGSMARQGIRSFFSFGVGLMLSAVGLSALVSELSPLNFIQAASVATLAAAAVLLTALVRAPRRKALGNPASNPGSGSVTG